MKRRIKISIYCLIAFISLQLSATSAQNLPAGVQQEFSLKQADSFSFNGEKISPLFTRENRRGNMALSTDLKYFLGKIVESTLFVLDLESRQAKKIPVAHKIDYAVFAENGKRVFVYAFNDRNGSVIDLETGKITASLKWNEKIGQAVISPDGERIALSTAQVKLIGKEKNVVHLWNAANGTLVTAINGCADFIRAPKFSSDGRMLLLDCEKIKNKPTKIFDARTGEEKLALKQSNQDVVPESFLSPDGETVVSVYRFNNIGIWDVASGSLKKEFLASQGSVNDVTFSRDGKSFATNGFSPVIRLWDTKSGELVQTFKSDLTRPPSFMTRVKISLDGKILAGVDKRGRVTFWETETGKVKFELNETAKKEDLSVIPFFGSDENVVYVRDAKTLRAVNLHSGKIVAEVPNPTGFFYVSADGRRVFLHNSESISVWNLDYSE